MLDDLQRALDARYLAVCTPEMAYAWLEAQPRPKLYRGGSADLLRLFTGEKADPFYHVEAVLLERSDPLIDYALARFGRSKGVCAELYPRLHQRDRWVMRAYHSAGGGPLEPLAALEAMELSQELAFWVCNPSIGDDAFCRLFEKSGPFEKVDEERYRALISAVAQNPRLSMEFDPNTVEGMQDDDWRKVFGKAWNLLATVDTTQEWAGTLIHLISNTLPIGVSLDRDKVLNRWRFDAGQEKTYFKSWRLRALISSHLGGFGLESEDEAVRSGAYEGFDPYDFPNWPDFANRDPILLVDKALDNENVFRRNIDREKLRKLVSNANYSDFNYSPSIVFQKRFEYWKGKRPEWFADGEIM